MVRRSLQPSLSRVFARLFGLPEQVALALGGDNDSRPLAKRHRLLADDAIVDALRAREAQYSHQGDDLNADALAETPLVASPLPPALAELVRRRVEAREHTARAAAPAPGQFARVSELRAPAGVSLDLHLSTPQAVLLDAPTGLDDVWYGWLVSPDSDYAADWDVVLEADDGPLDPLCAMVQTWNPVHVYVPTIDRVIGELPLARLQSVRAVAAECASGAEPVEAAPNPGRVALRTTLHGFTVLTGTPLGGAEDPRNVYHGWYGEVAEAVSEPARLYAAALQRAPGAHSALSALCRRLAGWLRQSGLGWQVDAHIEHAMAEAAPGAAAASSDQVWHIDSWASLRFAAAGEGLLRVYVESGADGELAVTLNDDGLDVAHRVLATRGERFDVLFAADAPVKIALVAADGRTLSIPLGSSVPDA